MINTVNTDKALNNKPAPARKAAERNARNEGELVASLASKTSWAWKLNATYLN
jgi:hypothetical protein